MTISSILFGVGLALLAGVFVARPFKQGYLRPVTLERGGERQQLLAQKAAVYAAIREIDNDVQLGKLERDDHRMLRQRYVAEGVAVLKALDALPIEDEIDQAIEADVVRVAERRPHETSDGAYCRACGAEANSGDRYCGRCGGSLKG